MITAQELRIGNLVAFNSQQDGEYLIPAGIYTTSSIQGDNTIRIRRDAHVDYGCFGIKKINSIPLTEEWLMKFGFIKQSEIEFLNIGAEYAINMPFYGQTIPVDSSYQLMVRFDNEFKEWDVYLRDNEQSTFDEEYTEMKISGCASVHQLQNLYFALTQTELIANEPLKS